MSGEARGGTVGWLLRFARAATLRLAAATFARLAGHTLGAAALAVPAWAIGMLATGRAAGIGFIVAVVAATGGSSLAKAVLRYLEQLLGHLAAFGLMGELRVQLLARLAPQAPAVTDGAGAARIQSIAVRDVDRVEVFFAHTIAPAVSAVVMPLAATVVAWLVTGPAVALTVAAVLTAGLALPLFGVRAGRIGAAETATVRADIAQHVADTLRLRDEIRSLCAEPTRAATLAQLDARLGRALRAGGVRAGIRHLLATARVWLGALAVLLVGAGALDLPADLPGLLLAVALVPGTITSLETVERLATSLPSGLEAARRVRAQLDAPPAVCAEPAGSNALDSASASAPALELDRVSFAYPGADPVLHEVSLRVGRGELVGVVGATGSGKSTIVRLAQRHWDPTAGTVRIDGVPAPQLGSAEVARRVVVADQEPFVLAGTVAENLRLADESADNDRLDWALAQAGLGGRITRNTPVGRRGARLSGGQRQRLALARTLVRAAPDLERKLLVLDEATSQQDPLTQATLVARLRALGATMLVIAHRLETLRDADRIVVFERGRVVEEGSWAELVASDGAFRALLLAQATRR